MGHAITQSRRGSLHEEAGDRGLLFRIVDKGCPTQCPRQDAAGVHVKIDVSLGAASSASHYLDTVTRARLSIGRCAVLFGQRPDSFRPERASPNVETGRIARCHDGYEPGDFSDDVAVIKVAIQGEAGAFSHEAVHQLLGPDAELVPCRTFSEAFEAVSGGEAERAVIPVENALAGPVVESLDLLWSSDLTVRGETRVRIRLCLSSPPGTALEDVRSVASHPVALQQCRKLFAENPHIESVVVYDTAGSVRDMMAGSGNYDAAISSRLAAELYGAHLLKTDVEDDHRNYTRFFELATPEVAPDSRGVCAAVAVGIPNEPGALYNLLGVFSSHGVDMSQIVARPIRGEPWKYRFYMEIVGPGVEALQACLEALEQASDDMRLFGTYAPYEEVASDVIQDEV